MLYKTTRGRYDVVTAYKAIHTDCYTDGGLFLPFRMPQWNIVDLMSLQSEAQVIARILNTFFGCRLSDSDVTAVIGKDPFLPGNAGRQVMVAELWRFGHRNFTGTIQELSEKISGSREPYSNWMKIAVQISFLFGFYTAISRQGTIKGLQKLDIAVATEDLSMAMAAWYAREMGLPVGNIICGCNANGGFWDLLNRGEFATGERRIRTTTPDADVPLPPDLERLICGVLGYEENSRYLHHCDRSSLYVLQEEQTELLNEKMFAAVISDSRLETIVPAVYRTCGYILDPYGALAFGGLQDFRAISGEENLTLLLAQRSPLLEISKISKWLSLEEQELRKRLMR